MKRSINEIIIHCTATRANQAVSVADITRWHKKRGFATIGYHFVIYLNGTVHNGRSVDSIGAHCLGHNAQSIGICYVGGLDESGNPSDTRTPQQKAALRLLLTRLKILYPQATIFGHRNFATKACPCFDAKTEYQDI